MENNCNQAVAPSNTNTQLQEFEKYYKAYSQLQDKTLSNQMTSIPPVQQEASYIKTPDMKTPDNTATTMNVDVSAVPTSDKPNGMYPLAYLTLPSSGYGPLTPPFEMDQKSSAPSFSHTLQEEELSQTPYPSSVAVPGASPVIDLQPFQQQKEGLEGAINSMTSSATATSAVHLTYLPYLQLPDPSKEGTSQILSGWNYYFYIPERQDAVARPCSGGQMHQEGASSEATSQILSGMNYYLYIPERQDTIAGPSSGGQNMHHGGAIRKRRPYTKYTTEQLIELQIEFQMSQYISLQRCTELSAKLGLTEQQIKVWFQNRRMKMKKREKRGK